MPKLIKLTPPKTTEFPGYMTADEITKTLPITRQAWEHYARRYGLQQYQAVRERTHTRGPKTIRLWKIEDILAYQTIQSYQFATPEVKLALADAARRGTTAKAQSARMTAARVQIIPPAPPPAVSTRRPSAPPATVRPLAAPARPAPKAPVAPPAPPALLVAPPPRPAPKQVTSSDMDRLLAQTHGDVHKIAAAIYPDQYRLRTQRPRPSRLADI